MADFEYPYQDVVQGGNGPPPAISNPAAPAKARVMTFSDEYDLKEIVRMAARKRVEKDGVHIVLSRTGLLAKMILQRHGITVELTTDDPTLVRFTR